MVAALKNGTDRMVIGPCTDGGYYLLGIGRLHARLFEGIDWSTSSAYQQTPGQSKEIDLPARSNYPRSILCASGFDSDR
jgi:glycosyltransferase A (GT-A) superfamily protein (DUF2064 family)